MTTITLWILVSIGQPVGYGAHATAVIDRFANKFDCDRVMYQMGDPKDFRHRCIEAKVVR